ncbi:MAG: dTDP-4-dehydrorhamnose 3,5-epimerase family protein, partial [Myxococcota bacterium]|nr:dTDP-4-dehydrorhamnose 3,5-epimerase family protein [Myxococcota bacterium]
MPTTQSELPAIQDVLVKPLTWYNDQRGSLTELVRSDQPEMMVAPIGQIYATTVYPGVVKGWHLHRRQWDRMVCLKGRVLLGLVDGREDSPTHGESMGIVMGDRNHVCVRIPPGVYHGLKSIGVDEALVVNVVSHPYDRD